MADDPTNDAAVALHALGWTLGDDARAERFLALTGLTPEDLRERLDEPATLAAALALPRGARARSGRLRRGDRRRAGRPARGAAAAGGMSRPLFISDCDEVILHFMPHFAEWIDETTDLRLKLDAPSFAGALTSKTGAAVPTERIWALLDLFFESEMHRQNVVPGAIAALHAIAEQAEIVILTNIGDQFQANRVEQLAAFDIRHRVLCNQGGKGRPVRELLDEMKPPRRRVRRRSAGPSRIGAEARAGGLAAAHGRRAEHGEALAAGAARPCPDRRLGGGLALDSGTAEPARLRSSERMTQDDLHHRRDRRDRRGGGAALRRRRLAGDRHRPADRAARRAEGRAGRRLRAAGARHARHRRASRRSPRPIPTSICCSTMPASPPPLRTLQDSEFPDARHGRSRPTSPAWSRSPGRCSPA